MFFFLSRGWLPQRFFSTDKQIIYQIITATSTKMSARDKEKPPRSKRILKNEKRRKKGVNITRCMVYTNPSKNFEREKRTSGTG
jgi:hypothetical protein